MPTLYFEFIVDYTHRFIMLKKLFYALKDAKNNKTLDCENPNWLDYFDEEAFSHFWWPSEKELKDYWELYYSIPTPQRFTDERLKTGWGFESMLYAIETGEYEFLTCELISDNIGRLEFDTWSWPYGSSDAIRTLIESFGFKITNEEI